MNVVEQIERNLSTGTVAEYSEINAELARLRESIGSVVPDCTTKEGYEFSKQSALQCREIRSNLESIRKEKKQPYLDYGRLIDSQAKEIKDAIESIEEPHKAAYQEYDAKKKAVLEARKQKIADLNNSINWAAGKNEHEIMIRIEEVECMDMSKEEFGRSLDEAMMAQQTAIEVLYKCHAQAIEARIEQERIEKERQELEQLRAEKAARDAQLAAEQQERERAERDARIAAEAEARARQEAEAKAKAEIEAAKLREQQLIEQQQREREEAERRQAAAVEAERQRQAAEQRAKEEAEAARAADVAHRKAINNEILDKLVALGAGKDIAKAIITASANGALGNMVIKY